MVHVFILTRNQERFETLRSFLTDNEFYNTQSWEDVESAISRLKYLDVDWKIKKKDGETHFSIESIPNESLNTVEEILKSENGEFPTLFISDFDLPIDLSGEHVLKLVLYSFHKLHGKVPEDFRFMYLLNTHKKVSLELFNSIGYISWHKDVSFEKVKTKFVENLIGITHQKSVLSQWVLNNF